MKGTTFTLSPEITKKIDRLRKVRRDTTRAQTIRFLILQSLDKERNQS